MTISSVDVIMSRHCYKKGFVVVMLIMLAVEFKTGYVSQIETTTMISEKKVDKWVPGKKAEIKQTVFGNKVRPSEQVLRQSTFNVSFLQNHCQSSKPKSNDLDFDLRVFVLTYNRATSVKRLLVSLNKAEYGNSYVAIEVWVDISVDGKADETTLNTLNKFKFDHGVYRVCVHEMHVGILGQWLIPWKPRKDSKEIAVILEDDLTVSPYFFRYLKLVHSKYRHMPNVNGFSLQGTTRLYNGKEGLVEIPSKEKVYLYLTLGTWGFSPKAENWVKFLRWFNGTYSNKECVPSDSNHVASDWYREELQDENKTEDGYWDMWHIYYAWIQREWTLYPNFPDHVGLTFNWKEDGLHFHGEAVSEKSENNLLEWKSEFESLPEVPVYVDNGGNILTEDVK